MRSVEIYAMMALALLFIGFAGMILNRSAIKKLIGLNIMGVGVFAFLIVIAYRNGDQPDPIPHAMVLTGIVVAVSATGFCLNIIKKAHGDAQEEPLDEPD